MNGDHYGLAVQMTYLKEIQMGRPCCCGEKKEFCCLFCQSINLSSGTKKLTGITLELSGDRPICFDRSDTDTLPDPGPETTFPLFVPIDNKFDTVQWSPGGNWILWPYWHRASYLQPVNSWQEEQRDMMWRLAHYYLYCAYARHICGNVKEIHHYYPYLYPEGYNYGYVLATAVNLYVGHHFIYPDPPDFPALDWGGHLYRFQDDLGWANSVRGAYEPLVNRKFTDIEDILVIERSERSTVNPLHYWWESNFYRDPVTGEPDILTDRAYHDHYFYDIYILDCGTNEFKHKETIGPVHGWYHNCCGGWGYEYEDRDTGSTILPEEEPYIWTSDPPFKNIVGSFVNGKVCFRYPKPIIRFWIDFRKQDSLTWSIQAGTDEGESYYILNGQRTDIILDSGSAQENILFSQLNDFYIFSENSSGITEARYDKPD